MRRFVISLPALTLALALALPAAADDALDDELVIDDHDDHDDRACEIETVTAPSPIALRAPPIGEVLAIAYTAAGLDRDRSRSWARRARLAGLVPWIAIRTGLNANWHEQDPEVDRRRTFEVRATWRLDRLVFDGRELQVASADAARRREQRRLASRVIRAYFAWRRVARAALRDSRWGARAEEAAAELDALTDGWFSAELARPRRTASELRTAP